MENTVARRASTLGFKILTSLAAFLLLACSATFLVPLLPQRFWPSINYGMLTTILGCVVLLAGTALAVLWEEKEKQDTHKARVWQAYLIGVIRYSLAFIISTYGFAKIFKIQFTTADFIKDMPLGEVNGFYLTWHYFGYSYTLAVIIALFQIGGSILLLFRRTTLLGTMVLLPVMVNILFINMFYSIAVGAFVVSILITLGLSYLLFLDFQKLKEVFWAATDRLPSLSLKHYWLKPFLQFFPIMAAFGLIYQFVLRDTSDKQLVGTWKVAKFIRNDSLLPQDAWLKGQHRNYKGLFFRTVWSCL
ncbi:hypothetical protein Q0590_02925 [Rhodocytophaga aerolata]|uniref:Uncharacterized protein n=1 Tax=Rhodocytophaga aerolata TaxID=455078 RepID=A0ABT8QZB5_9BACT|nr:hypothetical protein [Rhodocytophaga aerolata]MDO1445184.1 hypothetical protein [Rhodocytophaga aerolata]